MVTTAIFWAYRVFNGTSVEDAIAEMKHYDGEWFRWDAEYIKGLTPQRRAFSKDESGIGFPSCGRMH